MEPTTTAHVKVVPKHIGLLNQCLQKAKRVALRSIEPVYADPQEATPVPRRNLPCELLGIESEDPQVIEALTLSLEGPPKHLSYVFRLLEDAGLKLR